jgi:hypothetical protein
MFVLAPQKQRQEPGISAGDKRHLRYLPSSLSIELSSSRALFGVVFEPLSHANLTLLSRSSQDELLTSADESAQRQR